MSEELRARTLLRFEEHRRAWSQNAALRAVYAGWYARIREALPPAELGPRIELGSGPGFAREFIPDLILSDLVRAPWHDQQISADALPFGAGSVAALVTVDVLHHLQAPARFFAEATRVLKPGGRIVACEPYVGPLSFVIYKLLHEEPLDLAADPLAEPPSADPRDPFDANQALPTRLFGRDFKRFTTRFPGLRLLRIERLAGLAYPASGGFSRGPLLPLPLRRLLARLEDSLPAAFFRLLGFRLFAVLERG